MLFRSPQYADVILDGARSAFTKGSAAAIIAALVAIALGFLVTLVWFPRKARELADEAEYAKER